MLLSYYSSVRTRNRRRSNKSILRPDPKAGPQGCRDPCRPTVMGDTRITQARHAELRKNTHVRLGRLNISEDRQSEALPRTRAMCIY